MSAEYPSANVDHLLLGDYPLPLPRTPDLICIRPGSIRHRLALHCSYYKYVFGREPLAAEWVLFLLF